jgi:hypothetical protein
MGIKNTKEILRICNNANGVNSLLVMESQEQEYNEIKDKKWICVADLNKFIDEYKDLYDTNDIGLFDEFINDLKEMLNEEKK